MDDSEPVKVFVRVRPELDEIPPAKGTPEKMTKNTSYGNLAKLTTTALAPTNQQYCVHAPDEFTVRLMPPDGCYASRKSVSAMDDKVYRFDKVFGESATQEEIYESVSEQVLATVRGYNTTIFAYGVTGSGKSFTMTGNKTAPGIIPRAIGDIFKCIDQAATQADIYFLVRLSYVELYNNNFRNLLENVSRDPYSGTKGSGTNMSGFFTELDDFDNAAAYESQHGPSFAYGRATANIAPKAAIRSERIEVHENQYAGIFLAGNNLRFPVTSAVEAFQLIAKGNKFRATGSTNCNEESSRSHAILTFHVESRINTVQDGTSKSEIRIGKIHLVDLAGSENLKQSGADGDTLVETKNINSSLTALGHVLSALSKNAALKNAQEKGLRASKDGAPLKAPAFAPVPYRDSKLTHLLKDSLGGNSKTIMITTIRKTIEYYPQTMVSLLYSSSAKKIRNRSTVNRNIIGDSGIASMQAEFERLQKNMEERSMEFERLRLIHLNDTKENATLKQRLQAMRTANELEKKELENHVGQIISSQHGQLAAQKEKITLLQTALQTELTQSMNRIAEQEQEIKWLKKALDDTNQAVSADELEKMQHLCDVWQEQAKTAHQELNIVLRQAEELKTLNTTLEARIRELEQNIKMLSDEVDNNNQEIADLTTRYSMILTEKEQLEDALKASKEAYDKLKGVIKEHMREHSERDVVLKENTKVIQSLELERVQLRERIVNESQVSKERIHELTVRIGELEKDNNELNSKLHGQVRSLEKTTQEMALDAHVRKTKHELELEESHKAADELRSEIEKWRANFNNLQHSAANQMEQKDKALADISALHSRELQNAENLSKQLLAAQTENTTLKDKLSNQRKRQQEKTETMNKRVEELSNLVSQRDSELIALREAKKADEKTLVDEFARIMEEKRLQQVQELQNIRSQLEQIAQIKELDYQRTLQQKQQEIKNQEIQSKDMLRNTKEEVLTLIDTEIAKAVTELQERHIADIATLNEQRDKEKSEAVASLKALHSKEKQAALQDQEARLNERWNILTAEKLEVLRRELLADSEAVLLKARKEFLEQQAKLREELEESKNLHATESVKEHEAYLINQHARQQKAAVEEAERKAKLKYEAEIQQIRLDFEHSLQQKEQAWEAEKEEALRVADKRKEDALNKLKVEMMTELTRKLREASELHHNEMEALRFEHSSHLEGSMTKSQKEAADRMELKNKYDEQIRNLKSKYDHDLEENELRALQKEEELRRALATAHDAALVKVRAQHAAELGKKIQDLESKHNAVEANLRADFKTQLDDLQTELNDVKAALERQERTGKQRLEEQSARLKSDMEKQLKDLEGEHAEALAEAMRIVSAKDAALSNTKKQHQEEMRLRLDELEQARSVQAELSEEFEKDRQDSTSKAQQKLHEELSKVKQRHANEIARAQEDLIQQLESQKAALQAIKDEAMTKAAERHSAELARKLSEAEERHKLLVDELMVQLHGQHTVGVREALSEQEKVWQQMLDNETTRAQSAIEALKEDLQAAAQMDKQQTIAKLKELHVEELYRLERKREEELTAKLASLEQAHEDTKQAALSNLERELNQRSEEKARRMRLDFDKKVQDKEEQHRDELLDLQTRMEVDKDAALAELRDKHKAQLEQIRRDHDKRIVEQIEAANADLERTLAEDHAISLSVALMKLENRLNQQFAERTGALGVEHNHLIHDLEVKHEAELDSLRDDLLKDKEAALARAQASHVVALERLRQEAKRQSESDVDQLRIDLEAGKQLELQNLERSLKEAHATQIARLDALHKKEKETMKESFDQQLSVERESMTGEHGDVLKRADIRWKRQLDEQRDKSRAEMEQIEHAHQLAMDELTIKNSDALAKIKSLQTELIKQERDGAAAAADLERKMKFEKVEALATAKAEHADQVTKLSKEHSAELLQQAAELEERLANELRYLRSELEEQSRSKLLHQANAMEKEFNRLMAVEVEKNEQMVAQQTQRIQELGVDHDGKVKALFDQQSMVIERSRQELERVKQEHADWESNHQTALANLVSSHGKELSQFRTTLEEAQSKHQNDIDDLRNSHEQALQQLTKKHITEVQKVKIELEGERKQHQDELQSAEDEHRLEVIRLQGIRDRQEKEIKALKAQQAEQVARLEESIRLGEEDLAKLQADHRAEVQSKQAQLFSADERCRELSQLLDENTARYEQDKAALKGVHQAALQQEMRKSSQLAEALAAKEDEMRVLESNVTRMKNATKTLESTIDDLKAKHLQDKDLLAMSSSAEASAQLESVRREHERHVANINSEHEESLASLSAAHATEFFRLQALLAKESDNINKLHMQFQSEHAETVSKHIQERESLLAKKEAEHQALAAALKEKFDRAAVAADQAHQDRVQSLEEKLVNLAREHRAALKEKELSHANTLEQMDFQYNKEVQSHKHSKETHHHALAELEAKHRIDLATVQSQHKMAIDALTVEKVTEISELRAHYQEEQKQLIERMEREVEALKDKAGEQGLVRLKKEQELQTLHDQLAREQYSLSSLTTKHCKLVEEHAAKMKEFEVLEQKFRNESEQRVKDLLSTHDMALIEYKQKEHAKLKALEENHATEKAGYLEHINELSTNVTEITRLYHDKCEVHDQVYGEYLMMVAKNKEKDSELSEHGQQSANTVRILENKIALLEKEIDKLHGENALNLNRFQLAMDEKESHHTEQIRRHLDEQQVTFQDEHLTKIQEHMGTVIQMLKANSDGRDDKRYAELQNRFFDLVQDLPDLWHQKHGDHLLLGSIPSLPPPVATPERHTNGMPRTPIHVLANASADYDHHRQVATRDKAMHMPWSSPSLRASPTDQLIAAILDGDVQGIRTIVRSKGNSLRGEYWNDIAESVLPLQRAVNGLTFHGNERLLLNTLEVLFSLDADPLAVDHQGNTALHVAIHKCTSKQVLHVTNLLLSNGVDVRAANKEGDTALHAECKRLRTASLDMIDVLRNAGADVNQRNRLSPACSPLTLVLIRGASTTAIGCQLIGQSEQDDMSSPQKQGGSHQDADRARSTGRKIWIKAAERLIRAGAHWDAAWCSPQQNLTQLHLLVSAFPPHRDDASAYYKLLHGALAVLSPSIEDSSGRNALFVLCEAMAHANHDHSVDSAGIVKMLLEHSQHNISGADRTGRTVLDIVEAVPNSALAAVKHLLIDASGSRASHGSRRPPPVPAARYGWEGGSPPLTSSLHPGRVSSSVIAGSSRLGEAEIKAIRAPPAGSVYSSKSHQQHARTSASVGSRSYWEEPDEDDEDQHTLGSSHLAGRSSASHRYL